MKRKGGWSFFLGALIFFVTVSVIITVAMLIYGYVDKKSNGDWLTVSVVMFLVIVFLSLVVTLCDVIRRRIMVEKPMEKILQATERMTAGDFSVRLELVHGYGKYDEFDVIMDNLNTLAAELEKSEILKNDFISNVSHEMKTPISIIRNYAVLLGEKDVKEDLRQQYVRTLQAATSRLNNLVTNILKLNKLETGKLLPEREKVNLEESLATCVLGFEEQIEKKNLELVCALEEVSVLSVPAYLEIIWNNLISNAIKFTNEGGRVALTLKRDGENVVVQVEDSGCGISLETGKRIFEKFYQGDTSHAEEGNGLGLALVKRVIDILGGEISVKSEVGKGSTFTVVLKESVV